VAQFGVWQAAFAAPWQWRHGPQAPMATEEIAPPESAAACCKLCTASKTCGNGSIGRTKTPAGAERLGRSPSSTGHTDSLGCNSAGFFAETHGSLLQLLLC
jgi:hypothetical protein